jgi:hypothetical protein
MKYYGRFTTGALTLSTRTSFTALVVIQYIDNPESDTEQLI